MLAEYGEIKTSIIKTKADNKRLTTQLLNLQNATKVDQALFQQKQLKKKQLEQAMRKLSELKKAVNTTTRGFISAKQMSRVLNELTNKSTKLNLISLQNSLPEPITVITKTDITENSGNEVVTENKVYKHRMTIQLRGKYADITTYLHEIETMPWRIFLASIELQSDTYPYSTISIEFYTLSLEQGWLTL